MTADARQVETVVRMAMTVASVEPSPETEERWARRAETLAAWLAAAWHREQAPVDGMVIDGPGDGQRPADEDGDIRRRNLN